jgi:ankyrin repeat protein
MADKDFETACKEDDVETIQALWDTVDAKEANNGLISACYYGTVETVRLLLTHPKVDPYVIGPSCAFFGCFQSDDPDKLQLLLNAKDEPFDLNTQGTAFSGSGTLFWFACISGSLKCVRLLLEPPYFGLFDHNAQNPDTAETPLFTACWNGHTDLVRFMVSARYRDLWDYDTMPWRFNTKSYLHFLSLRTSRNRIDFLNLNRLFVDSDKARRSHRCFEMVENAKKLLHKGPVVPYADWQQTTDGHRSISSSSYSSSAGSSSDEARST